MTKNDRYVIIIAVEFCITGGTLPGEGSGGNGYNNPSVYASGVHREKCCHLDWFGYSQPFHEEIV